MSLNVRNIVSVMRLGVIAGIGFQGIANSYFKVGEGQEAIVNNDFLGYKEKVYSKGTHLIVPWIERPVIYDLWTRARPVEVVVGTTEFKSVKVGMQVLMHPREDLRTVLRAAGLDYEGLLNVLSKIALVKVAALSYSCGQFFSEKEGISRKVEQSLAEDVAKYGMVVDNVSIHSITVGEFDEFDDVAIFEAGSKGVVN